ncbi:histidine kinase [Tardiphaga sp. vice278]|uniref:histidine kinase n=1 Tax=Tardiphaga sp. vice278 TaxID=2592815 RepID=UPI001162821E|nr:histidine kinase [Tardiphaga sp. vice278]QDM19104.1 HAMP domain-containing protein [Tardiphaga sp. vice278]
MWKTFSLRKRICVLLGGMFLGALMAGGTLLWMFASDQILEENEPAARSAITVASALNAALAASTSPDATLQAFVDQLQSSPANAIRFRRSGEVPAPMPKSPGKVPDWFVKALLLPDLAQHIPVQIQGRRVGDLAYEPDLSAQVYEKWIGFLSLLAACIILAALASLITFAMIGAALRPLQDLAEGLARLRIGDFTTDVDCSGPPEIRESCLSVNHLAVTLSRLNSENRSLLRRMVSIQDEERRDISRELHDELGPLLLAIRANVTAMIDDDGEGGEPARPIKQRVLEAVEALQVTNRRILDRLRPLLIEELGLDASIQKLLRDVHAQVPDMIVTFAIDPQIVAADSVVAQTVYRVLQESITNVLKHAGASKMNVKTKVSHDTILVEVADNGTSAPKQPTFGRGMTGMRERLRALQGTFAYVRTDEWTTIQCSLPLAAPH